MSDSEKQTPTGRLSGAGRADGCFDCFRFAGGIIDVEVMTVGGCDVRPENRYSEMRHRDHIIVPNGNWPDYYIQQGAPLVELLRDG